MRKGCGKGAERIRKEFGKNSEMAGENRKIVRGKRGKGAGEVRRKDAEMRKRRARNLVNAEKDAGENRKKVRGGI